MFKNAMIFQADGIEAVGEQSLAPHRFTECGPTQEKSCGWVPPRGHANGALIEYVGAAGHRIMRFQIETKSVPGAVVARRLDERCAQIEETTGRKPGRRERKELREDIVRELLPHAFPKTTSVWVWLDPVAGRLVLDTSSAARSDDVVTSLVRACDGLRLAPLITERSATGTMAAWLMDPVEAMPSCFDLGRHVELESSDEQKSVVKFDRHHLDDEQMRLHIGQGKLPTRLELSWEDRVSFVLTDDPSLRRIQLLDTGEDDGSDTDAFDADAAIATGTLAILINDLVEQLGGAAA